MGRLLWGQREPGHPGRGGVLRDGGNTEWPSPTSPWPQPGAFQLGFPSLPGAWKAPGLFARPLPAFRVPRTPGRVAFAETPRHTGLRRGRAAVAFRRSCGALVALVARNPALGPQGERAALREGSKLAGADDEQAERAGLFSAPWFLLAITDPQGTPRHPSQQRATPWALTPLAFDTLSLA